MGKRALLLIVALCAFMTSCGGSVEDDTQAQAQPELLGSSAPSATSAVSGESEAASDVNPDAHEQYIQYVRERKEEFGYGSWEYAFYDIDQNGIDELIYDDGFRGMTICSYENGKVVYLDNNKNGGDDFKIYLDEGIVFWSSAHMDNYYDKYISIVGAKYELVASKIWNVKYVDDSEVVDECDYEVKGEKATESEYKEFADSLNEKNIVTNKQMEWNTLQKETKKTDKDLKRVIGEWKITGIVGTGYISSSSYPEEDFIGGTLTIQKDIAKFNTPGKKYDFEVEDPEYVIKWQSADDFFAERHAQYDSFGFENSKKVRVIKIKNHNKSSDDIGARFWIRDDDHIVIDGPDYYLAERQK